MSASHKSRGRVRVRRHREDSLGYCLISLKPYRGRGVKKVRLSNVLGSEDPLDPPSSTGKRETRRGPCPRNSLPSQPLLSLSLSPILSLRLDSFVSRRGTPVEILSDVNNYPGEAADAPRSNRARVYPSQGFSF